MVYEEFIAKRLAQLRIQRGYSARDLSLSIGQSECYINKIENGHSLPSMALFLYICQYLKVTPSEFFDEGNAAPERLTEAVKCLRALDSEMLSHITAVMRRIAV